MARKKQLGNPLLIAAGTDVAAKVATEELQARRQAAAEQRAFEREQQRQDELAANQIYAKQKGVDLMSAGYLRRRRNRIIAYSVLGVGAVAGLAYVAYKAAKLADVSDEAKALSTAIPPGIMENKTLNNMLRGILRIYPPSLADLKAERIKIVLQLGSKVKDFELLKKDYKTLTGNELERDITEKCSPDTWTSFVYAAKKSTKETEAGVVQADPAINGDKEVEDDEIAYNENNKGFYLVAKRNGIDYELIQFLTATMKDNDPFKQDDFLGWTDGKGMLYEYWSNSKSENFYHVTGKIGGKVIDRWVKDADVMKFTDRQKCINWIAAKRGRVYAETLLNQYSFSGLKAPSQKLRCIANTSVNGQLVKKGTNLGIFLPEYSTGTHYAFGTSKNNIYHIPKTAAAVII